MASGFFAINEGTIDRLLRVLIGIAGVAFVFVGPKSYLGLIGLLPLLTGLLGTCPLYSILGINTCGVKKTATSN